MIRQPVQQIQKPTKSTIPLTKGILQPKDIKKNSFDTSIVDIQTQSEQKAGKAFNPGSGFDFNKLPIQAKLKIGQPDDKYEQEADRVAEQVMKMPDPGLSSSLVVLSPEKGKQFISGKVQRACKACSEVEEIIQAKTTGGVTPEVTPEISSDLQSLQGGGRPLSRTERVFFEPRFGADFSDVRIHNGTQAAIVAQSINARALTYGHNVVFGAGEYASDSLGGRTLLAHELTHFVQQNGGQTFSADEKNPGGTIINKQKLSNVFPESVHSNVHRKVLRVKHINSSVIQLKKKPRYEAIILSSDEIMGDSDQQRKATYKRSGKPPGRLCKEPKAPRDKKNCPFQLIPGTAVFVTGGNELTWVHIEHPPIPELGEQKFGWVLGAFIKKSTQPDVSKTKNQKKGTKKSTKARKRRLSAGAKRWQSMPKEIKHIPTKKKGKTYSAIKAILVAEDFCCNEPTDFERGRNILKRVMKRYVDVHLTESNFDKKFGHTFGRGMHVQLLFTAAKGALPAIEAKILSGQIRAGKCGGSFKAHRNEFMRASYEVLEVLSGDLDIKEAPGIQAMETISGAKPMKALLAGVLKGAKSELSDEDYNVLTKKVAAAQAVSYVMPPIILSGAVVGIAKDIGEALEGVYDLLSEPTETFKNMIGLLQILIFNEEGARALGEAIGAESGKQLHDIAGEDIATFTYKLGELIGPTVVYTALSIVSGGAMAGARVAPLLAKFLARYPKAAKNLQRIGAALRAVPFKSLAAARKWIAKVLKLPASILKNLDLDAINRVRGLPDRVLEKVRHLSVGMKRKALGCGSKCRAVPDDITEYVEGLNGNQLEKVARKKSMDYWKGKETLSSFARHKQTLTKIAQTLKKKAEALAKAGQKHLLPNVDDSVLDVPVDEFIRNNPKLNAELKMLRNRAKNNPSLAKDIRHFLEGKRGGGAGKVGSRETDIVEFFLDDKEIVVTDITQAVGNPVHSFKTRFYSQVIQEMVGSKGPKVFGLDIDPSPKLGAIQQVID